MAIFTYILVFSICHKIPSVFGNWPPQELVLWYPIAQRMMVLRLMNMTAEILHDTTKKLKQAEKVRDVHKVSITFDLGTIAAGIQERFRKLLVIYQRFGNNKDFVNNKYTTQQYLHAYHVMQGEYNEIRLEKSLFHEIKKKYESTTVVTNPKKPKPPTGGGNRRRWSPPNEEKFYNLK